MSKHATSVDQPARHYDNVVEAWGYLLQEDLHYGYFATGAEPLVEATNALTNEMLALARLAPGERVLDIGCGTGKAGCRIASEFGCTVVGISPSEQCIRDASAKASALGQADRVSFQTGDGMAPDFPDASFDCTWVMESSHLMKDKVALLRECSRLLKPGGRLVLCDIMLHHKLSFAESVRNAKELLLLAAVYGEGAMEPLAFYEEQCSAHGLQIETSRNITQETLATFDHWQANAEKNRDVVTQLIGAEAWQQFFDSCDVLRKFWQTDLLGYGIISARKSG